MNEKMKEMPSYRTGVAAMIMALAVALAMVTGTAALFPANATEIRYVVNDRPVTSYDIERRIALLRLMQRRGNLQELAAQDMIDQTLRQQEIARAGINITDQMVNQSYASFASSNNLSEAQLDQVLAQAGVTKEHFKEFLRSQMGWGRVLQSRNRQTETLSEQDVVYRMLQQGGQKPTATEYMLQQVIFVVPAAQRGQLLAKRKREAQAMRDRFSGCDNTIQFAAGLVDVTVRNMGRFLAPELPSDWKDQIQNTPPGKATQVRETERGVEFIGVCSSREVSDDHVARMVFQSEGTNDTSMEKMSEEFTAELRKNARIIRR
ncbi:SurA N-terminal domain-containing protein [Chelativorans sp. Marseille-P2723]|uniref:SurA N-terminal domain-containing protein n=1 Tax=Chelativorans sp. Marseille-P2723 TaxID=2709133 RepID=UPI001FEDDC25|nr:SurA N-terminal domain-containing protein [Chelativorans sp. Marseille-P2723]